MFSFSIVCFYLRPKLVCLRDNCKNGHSDTRMCGFNHSRPIKWQKWSLLELREEGAQAQEAGWQVEFERSALWWCWGWQSKMCTGKCANWNKVQTKWYCDIQNRILNMTCESLQFPAEMNTRGSKLWKLLFLFTQIMIYRAKVLIKKA